MPYSAMEIIHADNYAALLIAILYSGYITPEQAFDLYDTGKPVRKMPEADRVNLMKEMRDDGMSWTEIAESMGLSAKNHGNSAMSFYSHKKHLLSADI